VARRVGLLNAMVFTHLPSNVLLLLVPLMPGLGLAVAVLLLRFSISQMDVPTWQSYTVAVVSPDERSAASGVTGVARSLGAAVSPMLATALMAVPSLAGVALLIPLLQRFGIADIIDRHLPPDPQLHFPHGRVLSLLLAARLSQPTALVNVASWAADTGADVLWDIPAASLNDDRLGRALDAFFSQRHAIQASVAAHTLELAELSGQRLHFDPTHLIFYGAYASSQPRPRTTPWPPGSADVPPAHITHGYAADEKLIHVGLTSAVDDLGAIPLLSHCLDGNHNNHTAIAQQCDWLFDQGLLTRGSL
jgi:hypothetical protein